MDGSKERIDFITEYIASYEHKIKVANKNGLFDESRLFELFAQEICNLWYGIKFINLNTIKKNYPCVDLLSEDGEIYVQVSAQEDIPSKIKKTLQSLEERKYPELSNISAPVFFVLSNETEPKVKDLVGLLPEPICAPLVALTFCPKPAVLSDVIVQVTSLMT